MNQSLWQPDDISIQNSTLSQFLSKSLPKKKFASYADLHQWSIDNREYFWQSVWEYFDVKYSKNWQTILDEPKGIFMPKWFKGSQLNFSENLLRYRDEKIAIEFHNESGQQQRLSYKSLFKKVAILADAFKRNGLQKGDRVAAVLPNIPETVIAMLACTSIGAIWSSSSPDFGTASLVDRFGQIKPKILLYCYAYYYKGKCYDCIDKIDALVKQISFEQTIAIAYGRLPELAQETPENSKKPPIGIGYEDYIHNSLATEDIDFVQSDFDHPVYILYSSGTTGVPKCIVHGAGGTLLQHCKELGLHVDLKRQDKLFYYTSTGWMMWNWQVSALALGATLVLYDGCPFYPHPTSLLDLVSTQSISIFGCSAKYIASLEKTGVDVKDKIKLTSLRMILSTGSPLAAESFDYLYL